MVRWSRDFSVWNVFESRLGKYCLSMIRSFFIRFATRTISSSSPASSSKSSSSSSKSPSTVQPIHPFNSLLDKYTRVTSQQLTANQIFRVTHWPQPFDRPHQLVVNERHQVVIGRLHMTQRLSTNRCHFYFRQSQVFTTVKQLPRLWTEKQQQEVTSCDVQSNQDCLLRISL